VRRSRDCRCRRGPLSPCRATPAAKRHVQGAGAPGERSSRCRSSLMECRPYLLPNRGPFSASLPPMTWGAALVPMPTTYGTASTCAGITELLDRECHRQPTIWLDSGDLTVGAVRPLLGAPPWADIAELPIAAAAVGDHEFDDGVPALLNGAQSLPFPVLCANADVGLPATTMVKSEPRAVGGLKKST
jgi:hypothetical protein